MSKCPNCGNEITFWETRKHTRWTPIICKSCKAKLHFSMKEWYRLAILPAVYFVIIFFTTVLMPRSTPKGIKLSMGIGLIIIGILVVFKFLKEIGSVTLEIAETMEKVELNLQDIENEIKKIKPNSFYSVLLSFFAFMGGMLIFYGFYHEYNLLYIGMGGIWLVVGVAVYTNGIMANRYKTIIKQLIQELKNKSENT